MKRICCLWMTMILVLSCCACGREGSASKTPGLDVDLTALSSTMVYAEVNNMMTAPQEYIGKKVKMEGQFARYPMVDAEGNEIPNQAYYACVIMDATACCAQGLEFLPRAEYAYPEDFPAEGENVTVVGTFQTYQEGQYLYCTLADATIE